MQPNIMLGYRIDRRVGYEVHIAFQGYPPSEIVYYFYAQDTRGETAIAGSYNRGAFALAVAGWRWKFGNFAIATGREPALRWLWGCVDVKD